jgi:hypothetical protein
MAETPLIKGRRYSYSSIEVAILRPDGKSEIFIDIDEISYSDSLDIAFVSGTNQAPVGWTAGTYSAEDTSLSMSKSTFQTGIVDTIGDGWLGSNLEITVKYNDEGEPLTTDVIICRISKCEDAHSFGPDPLKAKMSCKTFYITRNGKTPLKNHII